MPIPLLTLALVFILIAVRKVGSVRLLIWQVMLFGAVIVLLTGQISPEAAWRSVRLDVLALLFGMFVIARALEDSGYLEEISFSVFGRARSLDTLLLLVLFGSAAGSVFLMNDTVAIIGTPVVLLLARKNKVAPGVLLLGLAFGITIGSVTSPIGNPQNLLIALGESHPTFATFSYWLMVPTLLNLLASYALLRLFFKTQFRSIVPDRAAVSVTDPKLTGLARFSLALLLVLVAVKVIAALANVGFDLPLVAIAVIPALPILLLSRRRLALLRRLDWGTLVFFAAMFVLMESVWRTGVFQSLLTRWRLDLSAPGTIIGVSVGLSQFISNVPLVALLQPLLLQAGASTRDLMALAAGSTIAGNLSILGAASNVIIVQNAEARGDRSITFLGFMRVGASLTLINAVVYWLYLRLI